MTRTPLAVVLLLALTLAGCAAAPRQSVAAGPPASPAAGRSELATLEQRIETSLAALGLNPQHEQSEARELGDRATGHDAQPAAPTPAPPPAAPVEHALSAKSESRQRVATVDESCGRDPCRYTRAICNAASRICEIARYLEEPDARARCGRALQDCQAARKATQDRCPGC